MARSESDREDLLREATALMERAEFRLPDESEPVVAGFRRDGSCSLFFGSERVVQFNSAGQLRRGFFNGQLLKADKGRLVGMTRERTAVETILHSRELSAEESAATLLRATELIERLSSHLRQGTFTLVGQVPADGDMVRRILAWRDALPLPLQIAPAPNAR
jgi:hypothetical protein